MELSILVAKIIALIYISSSIAVLIGQINFNKIAADFNKSTALTFVAGSFGIIIGMVLVKYHNNWIKNCFWSTSNYYFLAATYLISV